MEHLKSKCDIIYFLDSSRRAAFVLVQPIVLCYHVGDHVVYAGRDLIIRKFRDDCVFCFDPITKFGAWYELYNLEVYNENKVVESVFRDL